MCGAPKLAAKPSRTALSDCRRRLSAGKKQKKDEVIDCNRDVDFLAYFVEELPARVDLHEGLDVLLEEGDVGLEKGLAEGLQDAQEFGLVQNFFRRFRRVSQGANHGRLEKVLAVVQQNVSKEAVQRAFDVSRRFLKREYS